MCFSDNNNVRVVSIEFNFLLLEGVRFNQRVELDEDNRYILLCCRNFCGEFHDVLDSDIFLTNGEIFQLSFIGGVAKRGFVKVVL